MFHHNIVLLHLSDIRTPSKSHVWVSDFLPYVEMREFLSNPQDLVPSWLDVNCQYFDLWTLLPFPIFSIQYNDKYELKGLDMYT